jgi:hypothetical protein
MTDDEIADRLSKRFDNETDDNTSKDSPVNSQRDEKAQTSQKAQNIKKEWNVRSFYLDDDLDDQLTTAFKRLDLDLAESDRDLNLKKTRHFYPIIIELGLEQLDELDAADLIERLD